VLNVLAPLTGPEILKLVVFAVVIVPPDLAQQISTCCCYFRFSLLQKRKIFVGAIIGNEEYGSH